MDSSDSSHLEWAWVDSSSDLRRVSSYWRGVVEVVVRVVEVFSSVSWEERDVLLLVRRLFGVGGVVGGWMGLSFDFGGLVVE